MFTNKLKEENKKLKEENKRLDDLIKYIQNSKIDSETEQELKKVFKNKVKNKSSLRYLNNCFILYKKTKSIYLSIYLVQLARDLNNGKKYKELGVL